MSDDITQSIRESYDRLADEYARRLFREFESKRLDRNLLDRFAAPSFLPGSWVCERALQGHLDI
jgi:hypothetical protein